MNSILTINKLGYATMNTGILSIHSESDKLGILLQGPEPLNLIDNIISRMEKPVKLIAANSYRLEFDPFNVYVIWEDRGKNTASFDEVELVKIIEIRKVQQLVLSRKAKTS